MGWLSQELAGDSWTKEIPKPRKFPFQPLSGSTVIEVGNYFITIRVDFMDA